MKVGIQGTGDVEVKLGIQGNRRCGGKVRYTGEQEMWR
jgi:hypothetical protein